MGAWIYKVRRWSVTTLNFEEKFNGCKGAFVIMQVNILSDFMCAHNCWIWLPLLIWLWARPNLKLGCDCVHTSELMSSIWANWLLAKLWTFYDHSTQLTEGPRCNRSISLLNSSRMSLAEVIIVELFRTVKHLCRGKACNGQKWHVASSRTLIFHFVLHMVPVCSNL